MADMTFIYCAVDKNAFEPWRLNGRRFPSRLLPDGKFFERFHRRLGETGSFVNGMHSTDRTRLV